MQKLTITPAKRQEIEREVLQKVSANTMQAIVNFCIEYNNQTPQLFYGGYGIEDVVWVYIFYLCSNMAYTKLQRKCGIPKSNYKQIFGTIRRIIIQWADSSLSTVGDQTADQRLAIAERCVQDEEFRTTFVVDGVHCRIWRPDDPDMRKSCASYKYYGRSARNYIVMITHDEVIRYTSYGYGARNHDITALKNCVTDFKEQVNWDRRDSILGDNGYAGTADKEDMEDMKFVVPHKKPKGKQLEDAKKRHNTRLASVRSKVERVFGKLKSKFGVLTMFRGKVERHEDIFRICCALYNSTLIESLAAQAPTRVANILN